MDNIYQKVLKLIKFFAILVAVLPMTSQAKAIYKLVNPKGETIVLRLALSHEEKAHGLSGVRAHEFKSDEGMIFINRVPSSQNFWMPNTYFNLDIIFLDKDLKIVGIESNVPFHVGVKEPPAIYRTKPYYSQHVLETKAKSKFSATLKINDSLKWIGPRSLLEIAQEIRP